MATIYRRYAQYDEERVTVAQAVERITENIYVGGEIETIRADLNSTRELLARVIETLPDDKLREVLGSEYHVEEDDGLA